MCMCVCHKLQLNTKNQAEKMIETNPQLLSRYSEVLISNSTFSTYSDVEGKGLIAEIIFGNYSCGVGSLRGVEELDSNSSDGIRNQLCDVCALKTSVTGSTFSSLNMFF